MSSVVLPGGTIGVLGGGQLGRMLASAARTMGYGVHVFSPDANSPAGQLADREVVAEYTDEAALHRFAESVDVVTLEFENVPRSAAAICESHAPVRPGPQVLHIAQNRRREKTWLKDHGFDVTPFAPVSSEEEFRQAISTLGTPGVLKTAGAGYDGKGQIKVEDERSDAFERLGAQESIYERFIEFERELSVIAARGVDGATAVYPPFENRHANHILDVTLCPAGVPEPVQNAAIELGRSVISALDAVGVLCVELFQTRGGDLLINEIAPRPHNSGHLTIEANETSQFEQQLRAVCGLPLGSTALRSPAAMLNLLGDLWASGDPDWTTVLHTDAALHLYGKSGARPGRKMGHVTTCANSAEVAAAHLEKLRLALMSPRTEKV